VNGVEEAVLNQLIAVMEPVMQEKIAQIVLIVHVAEQLLIAV
jgi:hypothetical protein